MIFNLSILTATLNARANILRNLRFYRGLLEKYRIEWVIQDSELSSDGLESFPFPVNVNYKKSFDKGIYCALNQAALRANSLWLITLGSDDTLAIDQFDKLIQLTHTEYNCKFIFLLPYMLYSPLSSRLVNPKSPTRSKFYVGMPLSHQCILAPRSLYLSFQYNLAYRYASDMDWLLNLMESEINFVSVVSNSHFVTMSLTGLSSQLSLRLKICSEFIQILRDHNFKEYELIYLYLSYIKTFLQLKPCIL